jgi:hypothetical protein
MLVFASPLGSFESSSENSWVYSALPWQSFSNPDAPAGQEFLVRGKGFPLPIADTEPMSLPALAAASGLSVADVLLFARALLIPSLDISEIGAVKRDLMVAGTLFELIARFFRTYAQPWPYCSVSSLPRKKGSPAGKGDWCVTPAVVLPHSVP